MSTTYDRRTGVDVMRRVPRDDDPAAETDRVLIYVRFDDNGILRTIARFPNGGVRIIL